MIYIEDEYSYNGTVQIVTSLYRYYTDKDGKYISDPSGSKIQNGELIPQDLAFGYDSINQDYVALNTEACDKIKDLAEGLDDKIFNKSFKIKKVYGELEISSMMNVDDQPEQKIDNKHFKKLAMQYLNVSELDMRAATPIEKKPKPIQSIRFSTSSSTTLNYVTFTYGTNQN